MVGNRNDGVGVSTPESGKVVYEIEVKYREINSIYFIFVLWVVSAFIFLYLINVSIFGKKKKRIRNFFSSHTI